LLVDYSDDDPHGTQEKKKRLRRMILKRTKKTLLKLCGKVQSNLSWAVTSETRNQWPYI
jgi:hypothetical protein